MSTPQSSPGSTQLIARRGEGTHRQYRIPSLAVVPARPDRDAVVLCVYDGRADLDDLPAPIDLLVRRSLDSGRTWEEPRPVRTCTGFAGAGDPSLLVDPATSAVLLFHSASDRAGFFESGTGDDDHDPDLLHCDLSISHDAGLTWEHRRLTSMLRRTGNAALAALPRTPGSPAPRIAGMFAASGAGCAITAGRYAGRLVQPFVLRVDGRIDAACAVSDDHGATWRLGAPIALHHVARTGQPAPDLNESAVCALPDGTLVLQSRGTPQRLAAVSTDGGTTFGPISPAHELGDASVNGSVICLEGKPGVLLASHCDDADLRRNLTVSRSDDQGATWRPIHRVEPGAAAYSQLAELPDGRIGIAYEACGYRDILFTTLDPAGDARAGSQSGCPVLQTAAPGWSRTAANSAVVDLVLRSIVPARPSVWRESGPTHSIDLSSFAGIDPSVFKEIGQDRSDTAVQVLRTRESLDSNLGPVRPGLHEGDELEVHARVRNTGHAPLSIHWGTDHRRLAPGEAWVRRDLRHRISREDARSGVTEVWTELSVEGAQVRGYLTVLAQ